MHIPKVLRDRLVRRQCVAFIGAGFSMACGMPGWAGLIRELIDVAESAVIDSGKRPLVDSAREALRSGNLQLAASLVRESLSASELDLAVRRQFDVAVFRDCSDESHRRMAARLRNLVSAPWAGIVTTNFDELIEYALAKWSTFESHHAQASDSRLGVILANSQGSQFFVKLHGSIASSRIVLTTEEYDRTYLGSPHVSSFLAAVMLSYHLVFVGCSLEDELVRIRRKLCIDFGGVVPMAYALLPHTRDNARRSKWLRENVQVECLLYDESDVNHASVDRFLAIVARLQSLSRSKLLGVSKSVVEILKQKPDRRIREIGTINLTILSLIANSPKSRMSKSALLEMAKIEASSARHLKGRATEEIVYRVLFLVSLKLLEESSTGGSTMYLVPPRIVQALKDFSCRGGV